MKLKIISDGTIDGTKVIDKETNSSLERISEIIWEVDASTYITKATITVINPDVDISSLFSLITKEFNSESQLFEETISDGYCQINSEGTPANVISKDINNKTIVGICGITWRASAIDKTIIGNLKKFKLQE